MRDYLRFVTRFHPHIGIGVDPLPLSPISSRIWWRITLRRKGFIEVNMTKTKKDKCILGDFVVVDKKERILLSSHKTAQKAWEAVQKKWFSSENRGDAFARYAHGKCVSMRKYIQNKIS